MKVVHLLVVIIYCFNLIGYLTAGSFFSGADSDEYLCDRFNFCKDITELSFIAGDVVNCRKNRWAYHTMLAIASNELIHVIGDEGTGRAIVHRSGIGHYVDTFSKNTGRRCRNAGKGDRNRITSVALAQSALKKFGDHNKHTFYSTLTCNCQHWVNYWANGPAWSSQTLHWDDRACQAVAKYGCTDGGRCWSSCGNDKEWCLQKNWKGEWAMCKSRDDCTPGWECGGGCSVHSKSIYD